MAKLKLQISVSLDGYITGSNPGEEHPLGEGGEALHDWALKLAAWREPHGREGGEVNASTEVFGEGTRLFDDVGPEIRLEQVRAIEGPDAAHLKYRVTG